MDDMPERIWAKQTTGWGELSGGEWRNVANGICTPYVTLDHANAMVGAALVQVFSGPTQRCHKCDCKRGGISCKWILPNDKPLDAQSALEAATQMARAEGYQQAYAAACKLKPKDLGELQDAGSDYCAGVRDVCLAILALKDKPHE